MLNLMIVILLCVAFGLRAEGTMRMRLDGIGALRFGRLRVWVRAYRPGRIYFRVGVTNGA